jgi:hypothetical protein
LATVIIALVLADGVNLKVSTEIQIRHEIGLRVDVYESRIKRYEECVSELRERLVDLEEVLQGLKDQEKKILELEVSLRELMESKERSVECGVDCDDCGMSGEHTRDECCWPYVLGCSRSTPEAQVRRDGNFLCDCGGSGQHMKRDCRLAFDVKDESVCESSYGVCDRCGVPDGAYGEDGGCNCSPLAGEE